MKDFKEIAEKCLAGELSGKFINRNGDIIPSSMVHRYDYTKYPYIYWDNSITINGNYFYNEDRTSKYDIVNFIPDNMQKKIEIDIPEGKVPVMEQTEKGVFITWKEKELTYDGILESMNPKLHILPFATPDSNPINDAFFDKVNILRKLTNIRNYFGKPTKDIGYVVIMGTVTETSSDYRYLPVFDTKEHAEQAIKMLGDELKYLFEPW